MCSFSTWVTPAEVWQATDTSLDRRVALKLVTAPHDESAARAADEARTLAQLRERLTLDE